MKTAVSARVSFWKCRCRFGFKWHLFITLTKLYKRRFQVLPGWNLLPRFWKKWYHRRRVRAYLFVWINDSKRNDRVLMMISEVIVRKQPTHWKCRLNTRYLGELLLELRNSVFSANWSIEYQLSPMLLTSFRKDKIWVVSYNRDEATMEY